MGFYEIYAKFDNYEYNRMKWVLVWGSPFLLVTKFFFFSENFHYSSFIVTAARDVFGSDRSEISLAYTHTSIFYLHLYFCPNCKNSKSWVIWSYWDHLTPHKDLATLLYGGRP